LSLFPYLGIRDYGDHPMIVLILSAIILKERMRKRIAGIILGLTGTAFLILYGRSVGSATNASIGNMLVLINAIYGFI
jgi:drug/metabolite transporter (DMT)-like permease